MAAGVGADAVGDGVTGAGVTGRVTGLRLSDIVGSFVG